MNEKRIRSVIPMLILLVLIFFLGSWLLRFLQPQGLPYSQVLEQFQEENVSSFTVKDGVLEMTLHEPLNGAYDAIAYLDDTDAFRQDTARLELTTFRLGVWRAAWYIVRFIIWSYWITAKSGKNLRTAKQPEHPRKKVRKSVLRQWAAFMASTTRAASVFAVQLRYVSILSKP